MNSIFTLPALPVGSGDHFFQLYYAAVNWSTAAAAATSATYNGWFGHLATLTSAGKSGVVVCFELVHARILLLLLCECAIHLRSEVAFCRVLSSSCSQFGQASSCSRRLWSKVPRSGLAAAMRRVRELGSGRPAPKQGISSRPGSGMTTSPSTLPATRIACHSPVQEFSAGRPQFVGPPWASWSNSKVSRSLSSLGATFPNFSGAQWPLHLFFLPLQRRPPYTMDITTSTMPQTLLGPARSATQIHPCI